jgi:signal transduction histidine kinase
MAVRVTEAVTSTMAVLTQQHAGGDPTFAFAEARDQAFAACSRELRFCIDSDGRLTHVEGPWQTVLGRAPAALVGTHWTAAVSPFDHTAMRVAIEHALAAHEPIAFDLRMDAAREPDIVVRWSMLASAGTDHITAVGYERAGQDPALVDARAEAARLQRQVRELKRQVDTLSEHSRSMEGFAATAAHQLSEPLIVAESGAIMMAEDLGDALDPELRARLDAIGSGAARARQMVDALLLDARSGSGLEIEAVDTGRIVAQVLDDLSPQMRERGVVAQVAALPAVYAEHRLLSVVFHNLISNAIKYGPRDGGHIRIEAERDDEGCRLMVASEGPTLEAQEGLRVFEPWHRVPGERRVPGSGLGLAICKRLIERLGGTIGVEPQPGGNRFYLVLPAA